MCTNGVNTEQLRGNIEMLDESVALDRRWTHRSYHLAVDGAQEQTAAKLKAAQELLDEVRALLDEAKEAVDDDVTEHVKVTLD